MDMNQEPRSLSDSTPLRWTVLLITSFAMAANYYFYDAINPMKAVLTEHLGWTSENYGFFVFAYSFPNAILLMAVFGGIILDKFGIRLTGTLFYLSMVFGSLLTYYGSSDYFNSGGLGYQFMNSFLTDYSPSLKMMSLGFLFFGLGAETTCVVVSKVVVKWFKGKELALALGINIAIARLGSGAAMFISPRLIEPDWTQPIWVGASLMMIGLVAFLVYTFFDSRYDKHARHEETGEPEEPFRISDIWGILKNPAYIFIALLCVTFYSAVFPFLKYAPDLMVNKYGVDVKLSGDIPSILPFGTILFTPLFGWIADKKGKLATLMIIGSFLLIVVHLLFALTSISPFIPMFILGIAFSLVPAAMWPSLARIVEQRRLGTAYGLTFTIQNVGLGGFGWLIGYVLDASNPGVAATKAAGGTAIFDYTYPLLMLACLGAIGLIFAFLLKRADKVGGFGLENSGGD